MRQNNLQGAEDRKKQAEDDLERHQRELVLAECEREKAIKSRKRKMVFHWSFTIAVVITVLWVLHLLPPP